MKPGNWDPCPGMWVLTRGSGKDQNSSASGGNSCQVWGKSTFARKTFQCSKTSGTLGRYQCLRELAVLEIIFPDNEQFPNNPDSIQCTQNMWSCAKSLGVLAWKEGEEVGILVWQTPDTWKTISTLLWAYISSMERLAEDFWNLREEVNEGHQKLLEAFKEEIFHALPVQTRVFAIRSRHPPTQREGTLHKVTCGFTCMEKTWRAGTENPPLP